MRRTGAGLATAAASAGLAGAAGTQPSARRPNILVILADDMGYSDLGCYGSEIRTPNLDGLAENGMRFTQFYCAARCCPSRATLLTGLYPHQAGMGRMVSAPGAAAEPGPYQGYLNDRCATIAEVLKPAGYRTYMSGKWHVGEAPEHWPRQRGFDRYFGLISGASSYFELLKEPDRQRFMALDDAPFEPEGDDFYMTDAFTDFAVECLEQHDTAQPFFLYLAYTAPHWPLHAWPEDIARYRDAYHDGWDALRARRYARMRELGIIDPRWRLSPRDEEVPPWDDMDNKEDWALRMAVYAAMIDRMDQGVGRVMQALRATGEEENTLVLFLSDNGACHENIEGRKLNQPGALPGDRRSYVAYRRPWANASNTPFRLFKHWIHEGGIATPLIARWPAVIPEPGALTPEVGHIIDIMATCTDVAGVPYPERRNGQRLVPLEGKTLRPVLEGRSRPGHDALYWEHFRNRGIRQGDWKLVATKTGDWELYDLAADRTELTDLSGRYPEKAKELNAAYDAWAARCGVS
ncbi:MAG: arylsulfatase [Candidatus Hydrogenedentes bacterium]|nr:arylsulfatase [Candidatus Hydrogenedentota bacterium]